MENAEKDLYLKMKSYNSAEAEMPSIISDPIGKFEYEQEGTVCVENEKVCFEFSYSFANYRDYVRGPDDVEGLLGKHPPSGDYRKLNHFVITDKKTNKQIDILEKLPSGYCVLFNPFSEISDGSARIKYKGCIILGDISSMKGVLTILHEIGHCVDYENVANKPGRRKNIPIEDAVDEEELNSALSKEWAAWSFTLNKIGPLLRSGAFPKDEVLKDIHGIEGLSSYCEIAKVILEEIKAIQTLKKEIKMKRLEEFESKLHELAGR